MNIKKSFLNIDNSFFSRLFINDFLAFITHFLVFINDFLIFVNTVFTNIRK